jgi:hypothetical protein
MKRLSFCAVTLILTLSAIFCDAQGVVQELEKYLTQVKINSSTPIPEAILNGSKSEKALLETLFAHANDSGEEFKFRVIDLVRLIGLKSKNVETRKLSVNFIVKAIADKNLRVSGFASHAVANFMKADFSQIDSDSILSYLRPGMPNLDLLFKVAGYLESAQSKEKISSALIQPMSPTIKWNARLALARLGDEDAADFILEKISTATIDDAFVYSLIPGLVYTRNRNIFRALEKILLSDDHLCSSSHPDSQKKVLCAYRVLEEIAPAIENFAIKVDESGDLLVDNYQSALLTAREWLKHNPDYKITRSSM